jgi:FAD synthetase
MKNILVFGVFDKLHKGHKHFLQQAKQLGNHLTVCVAQDEVIKTLKRKTPSQTMQERMQQLSTLPYVDKVLPGDVKLSEYTCIKNTSPDVIAIGYDQHELMADIKQWVKKHHKIHLEVLPAYKPDIYKTSLL